MYKRKKLKVIKFEKKILQKNFEKNILSARCHKQKFSKC